MANLFLSRRGFLSLASLAGPACLISGPNAVSAEPAVGDFDIEAGDHRTGDPLPFLMPDDFEDFDFIAWRVEPGRPDPNNPLLEPELPWDSGGVFAHGTVLRDPIDTCTTPKHPADDRCGAAAKD